MTRLLRVSTSAIAFWAASLDAKQLTFDTAQAVRHALESNPELLAARYAIARAEARLEATGIAPNPSLKIGYRDDFLFNDEGERSFELGLSKDFPLAKRLAKEKAVSRVAIAQAKMQVRSQELALAQEIYEFALEIHLVEKRANHLKRLLESMEETAAFAETAARTGEISALTASQTGIELSVLSQEVQQAQLERERLTHRLAPLLGIPSTDHVELQVETASPYHDQPLPGFDTRILERDPRFQTAVLQENAADAEIALAKSKNWDSITATLFWNNQRGIDEPVGPKSDKLLGLSLSIPLPLNKNGDRLARVEIQKRDQSRQAAAALRFLIENEVEHARHEASLFKESMSSYQSEVLRKAEAHWLEVRQAYQEGQINMLTLMHAQAQRLRLENRYLELYGKYAHALLELQLARIDIPPFQ